MVEKEPQENHIQCLQNDVKKYKSVCLRNMENNWKSIRQLEATLMDELRYSTIYEDFTKRIS